MAFTFRGVAFRILLVTIFSWWARGRSVRDINRAHVGEEPTNKWNRKILEEESFLVPSQLSRAVDFSRLRFLVGQG